MGGKQALQMANAVKEKLMPDLIWSSTLKRALGTAVILSEVTGVDFIKDDGLKEFNNGVLAALSFEEADSMYPEPEGGRKPHERIPRGESSLEF